MNRTLKQHIEILEERLAHLNERLLFNRIDHKQRNRVEAEIRAAQLALDHYRKAFELEQTVLSAD